MNRRQFLETTALLSASTALPRAMASPEALPVVDTHVHFYDPSRPEGVPWPDKNSQLYRTVLPANYRALPQPLPVAGVIVVEASPLLEDNQWVLDLAAREPLILGMVGNLDPAHESFLKHLKRFAKNPLFQGFRVRVPQQLRRGLENPAFVAGLKHTAELGLALDAGGGGSPLEEIARLTELIPDLRIIINHLAGVRVDGQPPKAEWLGAMRNAAKGKNVFCKISGLVEGSGHKAGDAPKDVAYYQPVLNAVWEIFGEDRLIYGSNWPVSELYAPCGTVQEIIRDYLREKPEAVRNKIFHANAQRAYRWRVK
ncbi:MAG: amidohydrolase family protein [Verrucomicrobiota bacterium]